jgi:hypothetical protein
MSAWHRPDYESRFRDSSKTKDERIRELEKENTKLRIELKQERDREAEPARD